MFSRHLLTQFAADNLCWTPSSLSNAGLYGQFQIYLREDARCRTYVPPSSSDYYKLALVTAGEGNYHYGDRCYAVQPGNLLLTIPSQVKAWEATTERQEGFFCVFTESFLPNTEDGRPLPLSSLFRVGASPVLPVTPDELAFLSGLFRQMLGEYHSERSDRAEALRIYLRLLLLTARRMAGQQPDHQPATSAADLTDRFQRTLTAQFPILSANDQLLLTTSAHFADRLAVHPNYLNVCVKRTTGRTVSEHIREAVMTEAHRLLIQTNWPVSVIAACLGFRETAHFSRAYKLHTGQSPSWQRG